MSRHPLYDEILGRFTKNGRLTSLPKQWEKRSIVLDHVAQVFEPGREYGEKEVNELLKRFHDDFAMLRRYLVDEGFMDRDHGIYRRSGGTWDVD